MDHEIKTLRNKLGLTRAELAMLTGRTERAWQAWELGNRSIEPTAAIILSALDEVRGFRKWLEARAEKAQADG